jgi:hypothetical protein
LEKYFGSPAQEAKREVLGCLWKKFGNKGRKGNEKVE